MISPSPRGTQNPAVTFWGAAQSVTGSMHLVEVGGERILLDCGSVRAERGQSRARATIFPFPPASVDAVVLSHAHSDHCGNLPSLVRQGFAGPIYCTAPTPSRWCGSASRCPTTSPATSPPACNCG